MAKKHKLVEASGEVEAETLPDVVEDRKVRKHERPNKPVIVAYKPWYNNPEKGDILGFRLGTEYRASAGEMQIMAGVPRYTGGYVKKDTPDVTQLLHRWPIRSCGRVQIMGHTAWVGVREGGKNIYVAMQRRVTKITNSKLDYPAPDLAVLPPRPKARSITVKYGAVHYPELVQFCQDLCGVVEDAFNAEAKGVAAFRQRYRDLLKQALDEHCRQVKVDYNVHRVPMDYARAAFGPNATQWMLYARCPTVQHALLICAAAHLDINVGAEIVATAGLCEYSTPVPGVGIGRMLLAEMLTQAQNVNPLLWQHKGAASWELGCLRDLLLRDATYRMQPRK